jgi:hypothetical protein
MSGIIIRAKSFKAWMLANFEPDQLSDIASHGADAGWHGLIYYTDTCKLYQRFKSEIWEMLLEDAESLGQNVFEMIANFGRAKDVGSADQFENLMTWYAAERIAREETDSN